MSAFATIAKNILLEHQFFTRIFAFKLFQVSIAVTNRISSKYVFVIPYLLFYYKLAKVEQNRKIRTTQNFDLFDKKLGY